MRQLQVQGEEDDNIEVKFVRPELVRRSNSEGVIQRNVPQNIPQNLYQHQQQYQQHQAQDREVFFHEFHKSFVKKCLNEFREKGNAR